MEFDKGTSRVITSCVVPGCDVEFAHPFDDDYPKHFRKRELWNEGWGLSQGVWHCPKHNPARYARQKKQAAQQAEGV